MTIEHSLLTGSALHEPKGVSTATANTVYVANGAGSGTWTTITNPFSTGLLHVREEQTSGTDGSTITLGSWTTRVLNSVKTNEVSGAALASNQITGLPSGTYWVDAEAVVYSENSVQSGGSAVSTGFHKLRLQNITGGSTLLVGLTIPTTTEYVSTATHYLAGWQILRLSGRFTLGSASTIELQHYAANPAGFNAPTNGIKGGKAAGITSTNEVYADIKIWKL